MGVDIISVFNQPEKKDSFLRDLACFGCPYSEDCEDDWEEGHEQCDQMMEDAKIFAEEHGLN